MSEPPKCCICLGGFTRPASLPCGHRFCLRCIGEYWRILEACRCPLCQASFPTRPQLKCDQTPPPPNQTVPLKAGEVPCDLCPARRPAVKSCLTCLASYCDAHLEGHYQREDLGRHLLISVVKNLEESVCRLHGKPLKSFCSSDRACICAMCAQTEHRGHHVISINREAAKKKVLIRRRSLRLQRAIRERQSKVEEIRHSVDFSGGNPKETNVQDKEPIQQLEDEIAELQERNAELEQLSKTEDNLHFVQAYKTTGKQCRMQLRKNMFYPEYINMDTELLKVQMEIEMGKFLKKELLCHIVATVNSLCGCPDLEEEEEQEDNEEEAVEEEEERRRP